MAYKTGQWGIQAKERSSKRNSYFKEYQRKRVSRSSPITLESKTRVQRLYRFYRELFFKEFGNKCCRCGFSDKRALQIDHINGGE